MNKSYIRKKLLKLRKEKYPKNFFLDSIKFLKFLKNKQLKSKIIGGYYPFNYELDILNLLEVFENNNFTLSLPKITKNNKMNFFKWSKNEPLKINKYGIPEPISNKKIYPSILLIPLVGFDGQLNRLGYGGGYYDRTIEKFKKNKAILTIGIAFDEQETESIPTDKYDQNLNMIITPSRIIA